MQQDSDDSMRLHLSFYAGFLLWGSHAMAQDVYPGCEVPTAVAGHHIFYVDPIKGSDKADGSAAHPWKSLNTVLSSSGKLIATKSHKTLSGSPLTDANPTAPIKGGDIIMLMSGDYGDVLLANSFNDKFITVMPAPGQKPLIQHLTISGAARWLFEGLTFQSEYPSGSKQNANTQVIIRDGWGDATKQIIFDSSTFQTTDDSSKWSDADWYSKPNYFAMGIRSTCTAVTNSKFQNMLNGFSVTGPQTLIKDNVITRFSNDAIDIVASKVAVVGNTIKDSMNNPVSNLHPDAIQVWSSPVNGKMVSRNSDLLFDSNKIYSTKSKDGTRSVLQGITVGFCDNVTIQNNVIVVNLFNAIFANGLTNAKILNNTVSSSDPIKFPNRIVVTPSMYNASKNVLLRNNTSNYIFALDTSVTMDHNLATTNFTTFEGGKTVWHPTGISGSKNVVNSMLTSNFRNWDPTKNNFDLHLKGGSALINMGSSTLAPPVDADGIARATPVALGAYTQ